MWTCFLVGENTDMLSILKNKTNPNLNETNQGETKPNQKPTNVHTRKKPQAQQAP